MDAANLPELTAKLDEARRLPVSAGHISTQVLHHGSMELRIFHPGETDDQQPHDRDELYIVVSGSAVLLRGNVRSPWDEMPLMEAAMERIPLGAGDAVVVPAGTVHRFVEISAEFATWMVFWGPEGGEPA